MCRDMGAKRVKHDSISSSALLVSSHITSVKCPVTRVALNRPPLFALLLSATLIPLSKSDFDLIRDGVDGCSRMLVRNWNSPTFKSHSLRVKMWPLGAFCNFSWCLSSQEDTFPPSARDCKVNFFLRPSLHSGKRLYCLSFVPASIEFSTTLRSVLSL